MLAKSCPKVSVQSRSGRENYDAKSGMDESARNNYGVTLNDDHLFRRVLLALEVDSEPVTLTGSEKRCSPKYLVARSLFGRIFPTPLDLDPGRFEEWDERTCCTLGSLKEEGKWAKKLHMQKTWCNTLVCVNSKASTTKENKRAGKKWHKASQIWKEIVIIRLW